MTLLLSFLALALVAIELALALLVRSLRRSFQWLITPQDEAPPIAVELIDKYVERSFDPALGWCRKPGEHGVDQTDGGPTTFNLDHRGRRVNPGYQDQAARVACFGDSFAFCRLVNDDETWPHYLSQILDTNAANYGVGNYGLDQGLLRLERELATLEADVVVMAVVPETICRVHSYWKHYFEYGNVLAFKPRFSLNGEQQLQYHPLACQDGEQLARYQSQLARLQALDPFFARKFRGDLLGFPHLPKLVRRGRRHLPILWHLVWGKIGGQNDRAFRRAFDVIMRENAKWTAKLYGEAAARALLRALIERFAAVCRRRGKLPLLVVIPQPVDLERRDAGRVSEEFFRSVGDVVNVVDLTPQFRASSALASLYSYARLGPHPSPRGNQQIARAVADAIGAALADDARQSRRSSHARE